MEHLNKFGKEIIVILAVYFIVYLLIIYFLEKKGG